MNPVYIITSHSCKIHFTIKSILPAMPRSRKCFIFLWVFRLIFCMHFSLSHVCLTPRIYHSFCYQVQAYTGPNINSSILTNETSCNRIFLEKATSFQLSEKILANYGTRNIAMFNSPIVIHINSNHTFTLYFYTLF
jgi:hypothetical protein